MEFAAFLMSHVNKHDETLRKNYIAFQNFMALVYEGWFDITDLK